MSSKNKGLLIFLSIFVFVQAVLDVFLAIEQFEDFLNSETADWIKYISIISCFLVSFLSIKTKKGYFVIAGLAFTLVADYFLLILDEYYVLGISAFIITQTMYFLYIKPKHWKISLVIRFGVFGLVAVLLPLAFKVKEASAFLAAFYFINLVMNAIDAYISKFGYGIVTALVGHGIGTSLHEDPSVPNYHMNNRGIKLVAGMTLAIEPMINLGRGDVDFLDDGWTCVTSDRLPSSHYENTILITKGEPEILTLPKR